MAHKKKHGNPVPPGNLPHEGPERETGGAQRVKTAIKSGSAFEEQDPKRRLGNFDGAGEHAYQQPGGKNDANR